MRGARHRLTMVVTISLVSAALLSGCAGAATVPPPTPAATANSATPAGFPVTVRNCGRTLTFDKPPTRAITGYQNTIEMMIALGLQGSIVARQGFPQSPLLSEQEDAYNAIKQISSGEEGDQTSTKEVTLSLRPDFFFATSAGSNTDGARGLATEDDLKAAGAQVFYMVCTAHAGSGAIDSNDTRPTIDVVYSRIEDLGKIFGVSDRAAALVATMKSDIAAVQERIKGRPAPRVFVYAGDYNGPTGPIPGQSDKYFDIGLAGGKNMLGTEQAEYPDVNREAIAKFNPEVFLTANYASGPLEPEAKKNADFLRQTFPNSVAVQNNRIVGLESIDFTPGVRNVRAVREVAQALFPDAFQ